MTGPAILAVLALAVDGWTVHTPVELATELKTACERAAPAQKPVLLGFSAPWCLDCKVLHKLEADPKVTAELARWERVVTDVGRFERHAELLRAFGGDRIAWWAALQPTAENCAKPVTSWPRLRTGGIEPASGTTVQSADDLVQWLADARGKGTGPATAP